MRLVAAYGSARLEARYRHGQEFWVLRWHAPTYHTHRLEAPTLAEFLVRLLGELPEAEQQRWTRCTP
ncbi:MAG TPA: hypothetical protein VGC99_23200 [Candidatus Tectomicrobia bacterium]